MTHYIKDDLPAGTILLTVEGEKLEVASDEYHETQIYGDVWFTTETFLNLSDIGPDDYADIYKKTPPTKGFAKWVNKMEKELT